MEFPAVRPLGSPRNRGVPPPMHGPPLTHPGRYTAIAIAHAKRDHQPRGRSALCWRGNMAGRPPSAAWSPLAVLALLCVCAGSTLAASALAPTAQAVTPRVAAVAAAPAAQRIEGRSGRRKAKDADKIISQLTLEEKLSLLNTDSPAINRSGLHIPAFNWW